MACKYANIFGKPKEGVHSIRIFDIAVVDLLLTFVMAFVISRYALKGKYLILIFIILLLLGILVHRLFCVNTTINKLVFGKVPN